VKLPGIIVRSENLPITEREAKHHGWRKADHCKCDGRPSMTCELLNWIDLRRSLICANGERRSKAHVPTHQISASTPRQNLYMTIYYSLFFSAGTFSQICIRSHKTLLMRPVELMYRDIGADFWMRNMPLKQGRGQNYKSRGHKWTFLATPSTYLKICYYPSLPIFSLILQKSRAPSSQKGGICPQYRRSHATALKWDAWYGFCSVGQLCNSSIMPLIVFKFFFIVLQWGFWSELLDARACHA